MTPTPAHELALSPWALFDDDGSEMLVVNAFDMTRQVRLFHQRDEIRRLLELPRADLAHVDAGLVEELTKMGVLVPGPQSPLPQPHGPDKRCAAPFLRRAVVSIDVSEDSSRQVEEVSALCLSYARADPQWRLGLHIHERDSIERVDGFTSRLLTAFGRAKLDRTHVDWNLRLERLPDGTALPTLLDQWPGLHVSVEDRSEIEPSVDRADLFLRVRDLAKLGYVVQPVLLSRCGLDLVERVHKWQAATDRAGVVLELLVSEGWGDTPALPLDSKDDFARAFDVVAEVARTLETSLVQSEPWRSILTHAAVPGFQRHGWAKDYTRAHLTRESNWARSPDHGQAFLFSPPQELLPFAFPRSEAGRRSARNSGAGWPACPTCPFAPLCDGYWSAQVDVLDRTGRTERAANLAAFECELRKDALTALLLELRREAQGRPRNGRTRAKFIDGILTLQRTSPT